MLASYYLTNMLIITFLRVSEKIKRLKRVSWGSLQSHTLCREECSNNSMVSAFLPAKGVALETQHSSLQRVWLWRLPQDTLLSLLIFSASSTDN